MDNTHDADEAGLTVLHPAGWARPRGYSNGIAATGRQVFVAGQIGWDAQCRLVSGDFAEQARQALRNVVAVLTPRAAPAASAVPPIASSTPS